VGKTTVVDKLKGLLSGSKLVTFGTVMLEEGMRLKWIKHRDELRKLPVENQRKLQTIAARKIASMREAVLIVDTHLFIKTREGFWPGLPFEVVRALKPTHLVLVEASASEIARRRTADKYRYRDTDTEEELNAELSLARSFLTVSSTLTGAPMMTVTNSDDRADSVTRSLAKMIAEAAS